MVIPALEASLESAAEPEGDAAALWPWDLQGTPPKARSVSTGGGAQATTSREEGGGGTPDTSAQTSSGESVRRVGQASRSGESVRRVGGKGSTDTSREEERRAQQIPEQTSYCSYNPRQGQ